MLQDELNNHLKTYRQTFSAKSEFGPTQSVTENLSDVLKIINFFNPAWKEKNVNVIPGTHTQNYPFDSENERWYLKIGQLPKNLYLHTDEWISEEVREAGILSTEIVLTDTSRRLVPFDFQIQKGNAPTNLRSRQADDANFKSALNLAARELRKIHQIHLSKFGHIDPTPFCSTQDVEPQGIFETWASFLKTRLDEHISYCFAIGAINAEEVGRINILKEQFERLENFNPSLLHNDLSNTNITIDRDNEKIGFLDWSDAIAGDPVFDLANFCSFHMPEYFKSIWSGYFEKTAMPSDFYHRFWLYYLRIALAKTVHRHRFKYKDNDKYPPASRRIQIALERLLFKLAF